LGWHVDDISVGTILRISLNRTTVEVLKGIDGFPPPHMPGMNAIKGIVDIVPRSSGTGVAGKTPPVAKEQIGRLIKKIGWRLLAEEATCIGFNNTYLGTPPIKNTLYLSSAVFWNQSIKSAIAAVSSTNEIGSVKPMPKIRSTGRPACLI